MSDQRTAPLFFEDFADALKEIARAAGGMKIVGSKLWPELEPDRAGGRLADCLNSNKRDHLSPEQVLLLLRIGRQIGCHVAMEFVSHDCGYAPPVPVEPEDEVTRLQREFVESTKQLTALAERIEAVQLQARSMRRVA